MKFYLAARFTKREEMKGVRDVLRGMGHEVTSRWLDSTEDYDITNATLDTDPDAGAKFAKLDYADIGEADALIFFSARGDPGMGGRFVEWGYAWAVGKDMIIVGPRENVFHCMELVEWYPDWPHFVMALARKSEWPIEKVDTRHDPLTCVVCDGLRDLREIS